MSACVCEEYASQISNINKLELQVVVVSGCGCCKLNSVLSNSNTHLRALYQSLLTANYYFKSKTSCLMIHNFILAVSGNIVTEHPVFSSFCCTWNQEQIYHVRLKKRFIVMSAFSESFQRAPQNMRTGSENLGNVFLERFLNQITFLLISPSPSPPSPLPPLSSFSPLLSCPLHSSLLFFSLFPAWPCPSFTTLPQLWNTDLSIGIISVYHHAWSKEPLFNTICH